MIYRNIRLYRLMMNVLYLGRYTRRFDEVIACLDPARDHTVLEFCFGDVYVAEWCRRHGIEWTGIDLNAHFVDFAAARGYRALHGDLREQTSLPAADVVVTMGSLYHFHDMLAELLERVMAVSRRWVISEPIRNLSSAGGLLGMLASRSADAGHGHEVFRYDERTLAAALAAACGERYEYELMRLGRKDAVWEVRWKSA